MHTPTRFIKEACFLRTEKLLVLKLILLRSLQLWSAILADGSYHINGNLMMSKNIKSFSVDLIMHIPINMVYKQACRCQGQFSDYCGLEGASKSTLDSKLIFSVISQQNWIACMQRTIQLNKKTKIHTCIYAY